jgi:hypothetical protein
MFATFGLSRVTAFLPVVFLQVCLASRGDESPSFQSCVRDCISAEVNHARNGTMVQGSIPTCAGQPDPGVRFPLSWDCESECKYRCMWEIEAERMAPPEKYFGKWPFVQWLSRLPTWLLMHTA